jgi:hypothetical protein
MSRLPIGAVIKLFLTEMVLAFLRENKIDNKDTAISIYGATRVGIGVRCQCPRVSKWTTTVAASSIT